tara:strand:- start:111 stop:1199 length:1089 start_codon:yes stop_codon:yes gene_type:complete
MPKIFLKKNFKGKTVIVTGHTGFKGSWLTLWLISLGAKVIGISSNVPSNPSNFKILNIKRKIINKNIDIRNLKKLKNVFKIYKPNYVFHLSAQSLVKESYIDPTYTFETNSIGTLNVLESLKSLKNKCTAILITSDKSYKNLEITRGYKEDDILGGSDPYSASKASAELIIKTYVKSFFKRNNKILIGIARAGNVIGGGDWSNDRLVPDCVKSWSKDNSVKIRNPKSTRPWQHVLEAVGGYLIFAIRLNKNKKLHGEAFNFGPSTKQSYNVIRLVKSMKKYWKKVSWKIIKKGGNKFFESNLLKLNCHKANKILNWKSILSFDAIVKMTALWYSQYYSKPKNILSISLSQIKDYEKLMNKKL